MGRGGQKKRRCACLEEHPLKINIDADRHPSIGTLECHLLHKTEKKHEFERNVEYAFGLRTTMATGDAPHAGSPMSKSSTLHSAVACE